jgi:hypothetical protein
LRKNDRKLCMITNNANFIMFFIQQHSQCNRNREKLEVRAIQAKTKSHLCTEHGRGLGGAEARHSNGVGEKLWF